MYIFDEISVEEKPLGIPYFRSEPGSHSYVNLREEPGEIDLLPELTDCPPLRDLVMALNAPTGPFETFGCEKWIRPWADEALPGYRFRFGCYVDLAFVNKEARVTQTFYRRLIEAFRQYAVVHRVYDLMHVGFELRPTISGDATWWTLGIWIFGIGRDEADAKHWWQEAVKYMKAFLITQTELVVGF
ncbi:MAG: hypothetical protein JSR67_11110 [Proteobacteria bacterium]|nr:hypothetical protein [Pseudomonadota bacterium]